jgi:hypothetical protein
LCQQSWLVKRLALERHHRPGVVITMLNTQSPTVVAFVTPSS